MDTSVWRRHFAGKLAAEHAGGMRNLLDEDDAVLVHPWVIGELVLGGLSAAEEELLAELPTSTELAVGELLQFVRKRRLERRGIGWVDVQLLASALVDGARVWAIDEAFEDAAKELDVRFDGPDT